MRLVIIESPFAPKNGKTVEQNIAYARRCVRDSLHRGEAPLASHLLYTQPGVLLADNVPEERELGIAAGLAWGRYANATCVYMDYGVSEGMQQGIDRARKENRPVEFRFLCALAGRDLSAVAPEALFKKIGICARTGCPECIGAAMKMIVERQT